VPGPVEPHADPTAKPPGEPVPATFLALLGDAEREAIYALGGRFSFPRGAALMFQHDPDVRVMLLLSGRVKVTRVDEDGHELLLSVRDPGDVLGELAFIDGEPRVATVTALEPVHALVAPGPVFRHHLETTPRIATVLLEIVARRFRETTLKRSQFASLDTMGRLAARIVELADRYGEPADGAILVNSPLSQEDLAAWTGASRAGVANAFHALRELGWVQTERRKLLVRDLQALRARAG
jgi:CRP/FNR family cyclic AMP-dependent transcriptional regulator